MRRLVLLFLAAILIALSGCQQAAKLEGSEFDSLAAKADPLADSIVTGLTTGDYAIFSQHFDQAMLNGMPQEAFEDMRALFQEKLGDYQSREVLEAQDVDDYHAVVYKLVFANAPEVSMRLVLNKADNPQVTGLWFDSPELR